VYEEQVGIYSKVHRFDLCESCQIALATFMSMYTARAEILGVFNPLDVPDDPFPAIGVYGPGGNRLPDPRPGVAWWVTPTDPNRREKQLFSDARRPIWDWGHAQKDGKGKPRFPKLSQACVGALPKEVGFAWTNEVWLPTQGAPPEPADEDEQDEQALIPAPPKPARRRR